MNKKNLMSQMVNPINSLTIKDLPVELLELSEEDLQQVVGGTKLPELPLSLSFTINENWSVNLGVKFKLDKLQVSYIGIGLNIPI